MVQVTPVAQVTPPANPGSHSWSYKTNAFSSTTTAVRTQGTLFQQQSYWLYYTLWDYSLHSEGQKLWHTQQLQFALYTHYHVYFHHKELKQTKNNGMAFVLGLSKHLFWAIPRESDTLVKSPHEKTQIVFPMNELNNINEDFVIFRHLSLISFHTQK